MKDTYFPPVFKKTSFHCPNCGVLAMQQWHNAAANGTLVRGVHFAFCSHCSMFSIWFNEKMIEPSIGAVPLPNPDLPDDIIVDYKEARDILNKSVRGAAALLRLAVQKLCKHLGEKGENINSDIGNLVKKGLSPMVQQSLDYVRVVGNNAVHPGQIDIKDDLGTALALFTLVNIIADIMTTQPKHIKSLYESLPANTLNQIERRDNGVKTS